MPRRVFSLLKLAGSEWIADKAPRLAAATAFYTILSLAPLLVISVSIAGLAFGKDAARSGVVHQSEVLVGRTGAVAVQQMLENSSEPSSGAIAIAIGVATLLVGASGVFSELKDAFNTIWKAPAKLNNGFVRAIKDRFFSFAMVLCVGFLLLVSLGFSTAISGMSHYLAASIPGFPTMMRLIELLTSFGAVMLVFAMMFKYLPDCDVPWKDAWIGAAATSALFSLGKYLIGLYLAKAAVATPFGAAGSLVALVVWIYYSAMILFFGAELTQAMTQRRRLQAGRNREEKLLAPTGAN